MDSRTFLGLRASHNPYRWSVELTPGLCTGLGLMFGGCGLAAAISALEGTSGRQCVWATGQYLSHAAVGEFLDVDVTLAVEGNATTQARAVCHVGNREILTVNAALGERAFELSGQWEQFPFDVPRPEDCRPRPPRLPADDTIHSRTDQRVVKAREPEEMDGTPGDGRSILWARIPEVLDGVDATALAVMGDFMPMGVGQARGILGGGTSLDNTLRVVHLVPTEWVLCDIQVHAVERGFGHGLVHLYAEDGTLLAIGSQSCMVRYWKDQDGKRLTVPAARGREEA